MKKPSPSFIAFAAVGTAIVTLIGGCTTNEIREASREKDINEAAEKSCVIKNAKPHTQALATWMENDCRESVGRSTDHANRYSLFQPLTTLFRENKQGNLNYTNAKGFVENALPQVIAKKFEQTLLLDSAQERLNEAVRNIVIDGKKPLKNTDVTVNFESVTPVVFEKERDTPVYTGKVSISVLDKNSNAARNFSYDHITGNITQSSAKTEGTFSFNASGYSYGYRYRFVNIGGEGSITLDHQTPVSCTAEQKISCAIVDAALRTLNNLPAKELENIRELIAESKKQPGESGYSKYRVTASKFPGLWGFDYK